MANSTASYSRKSVYKIVSESLGNWNWLEKFGGEVANWNWLEESGGAPLDLLS